MSGNAGTGGGGPVLVFREEDLAVLTLNRPERRNALDLAMVEGLHEALDALWHDDSVGALILTGAGGKAFAAGADIAELAKRGLREALSGINSGLFRRVEEFPAPVLAAVRGHALGGGCELAMACDLRVAGTSSRFGQPEVALGIVPGAGGLHRLPRLVGLGRAKDLVLTGRILDAAEAHRIGLVDRVVDDAAVLDEARSLAGEILAHGRLAVRLAKAAMTALTAAPSGPASLLESLAQGVLFETEEKKRRMEAFLARRRGKDQSGGGGP